MATIAKVRMKRKKLIWENVTCNFPKKYYTMKIKTIQRYCCDVLMLILCPIINLLQQRTVKNTINLISLPKVDCPESRYEPIHVMKI